MTTHVRNFVRCPTCNANVVCPKCGKQVRPETPFSAWLRALDGPGLDSGCISNQNLDYIWHNYMDSWFITIEEKRGMMPVSKAQSDTHGVVSQLLMWASGKIVNVLRAPYRRPVQYRGHFVIQFERTTPDDGKLRVDGNECTVDELLGLLRTGVLEVRGKRKTKWLASMSEGYRRLTE